MADLSEQSLIDAMASIHSVDRILPTHLMVTDAGLDIQAQRMLTGEITATQLQEAGVPDDIILDVVDRMIAMMDRH